MAIRGVTATPWPRGGWTADCTHFGPAGRSPGRAFAPLRLRTGLTPRQGWVLPAQVSGQSVEDDRQVPLSRLGGRSPGRVVVVQDRQIERAAADEVGTVVLELPRSAGLALVNLVEHHREAA